MTERISPGVMIWESPCGDHETVNDGAERFIVEAMGAERTPRFAKPFDGRFWFHDSAWVYRITCCGGHWEVFRTGEQSKRGKAYSRARRETTR